MKANEYYQTTSNFLKPEDLNKQRLDVVIEAAELQEIGDDTKIVLFFKSQDKQLVLNKTNADMITELFGTDETDEWIGKSVTLRPDMTRYAGRPVACIRIDMVLPNAAVAA